MQALDDNVLLREYAEHGSEEAFAALVAHHVNMVYSVALRHTGNAHHAEEITQTVFIILARKSRRLGKDAVLEGWLHQAACLTSLAFLRREARRARREQEAYMQSNFEENEPDIWPKIAPLLDTVIGELSETDRHAVMLRFFYGKSMKEVGASLGASEGAARLRVHRAMEKLRHLFYKRGILSTTEAIAGTISAHAVQAAPVGLVKTATALALSQGPAASSPGWAGLKGAVQATAWTKAKTIAVTGALALLAAGASPVIIQEFQGRAQPPAGPAPRITAATGTIRGQLFHLAQLVDAGNATPEAAWETHYWARSRGEYDSVLAGTFAADGADAKGWQKWIGDKDTFRFRTQRQFASFSGFQILARKVLAGDRVELKYRIGFEDNPAAQPTWIAVMVRADGVWKCARTHPYAADWDSGSQPEPQS